MTTKFYCEEEGCKRDAIECRLFDGEIDGYYCGDHAAENGFCCCCGSFAAGTEAFDFIHPGLCDACYEEMDVEIAWEDEEDWRDLN